MNNEVTKDASGAIQVEKAWSGTDYIGVIWWRKGTYFYMPQNDMGNQVVISTQVMRRITERMELLTRTKPVPDGAPN